MMSMPLGPRVPVGGIVLCGGASRRMGRPKAWLPFGNETTLQRLVRRLGAVVDSTVVVSAAEQELPPLPADVVRLFDEAPERGPLEGMRIGLRHYSQIAEAVFVTSCDVPWLRPAFISRLLELLESFDAVVPCDGERWHVLTAVYRPEIVPIIERLLALDQRRVLGLCEKIRCRLVPVNELRPWDDDLRSLLNMNHPADYQRALALGEIDA